MKNTILSCFILGLLLSLASCACNEGSSLQHVRPELVGLSSEHLSLADDVINASINKGETPGAVLAVVRGDKLAYIKAYGNKSVFPDTVAMTPETIFDMASVSKSIGTTLSFMQLIEEGKVRLTDPVSMYIPGFEPYIDPESERSVNIRVVDLLTHTSGLPSYVNPSVVLEKYGEESPEALIKWISTCKRESRPTTRFNYSCLNFVTLQNILQNVTGEKLSDYAQKNVFDVLGLKHTTYFPIGTEIDPAIKAMIAPTEVVNGKAYIGEVHDPIARVLNKGNSGNAGLFSNAEDLAVIAAALMNGGEYNGKRILGNLTVETMTRVPDEVARFGRSLGWDNCSPYASNNGNLFDPKNTYGHTGYTGTSIIIDPVNQTAVILLTNRVHPADNTSVVRLRALVANIVAGAIID